MLHRICGLILLAALHLNASAAALDPNAFASLGVFNPGSNVSVNTDTLAMTGGISVTGVNSGGVAVFTFTSFNLAGPVTITVTGSRPIALLSRSTMTISGTIQASASSSTPGPGGFAGNTAVSGGPGLGPGAGGGDSQGGGGAGHGAIGGSNAAGAIAGIAYGDLAVSLQGGSGGGTGTFLAQSGRGGGGGGAVELGSVGSLTINGTGSVRANGGAGGAFLGNQADGGGGGSGGAIYVHGNPSNLNAGSLLRVDGGIGGNGGTQGVGGGGGAGGRIRVELLAINAGIASAVGGTGGSGSIGAGLAGGQGEILLLATPSVFVTASGGSTLISESGTTDTYAVVLGAQPSGNVTIAISPDSQSTVSPTALTFTASNWSTPQAVTVSAVNDAIAEGSHTSTISHSASGGGYAGVSISQITATITDNDAIGVTLVESVGSTAVAESGSSDSYTLVLNSQPTATVTLSVNANSQLTATPAALSFTAANWNTPQTVTVQAIDDAVAEGAHTGVVSHSASGGGYTGLSIGSVTATIADNDTAGVVISESAGSTAVTEAGGTDSYTVTLTSQPSATVTISPSASAQLSLSPSTLSFSTSNWNVPQTVTVSAVNDAIAEGPHTGAISHGVSGGGYTGVSIAGITVSIADNDVAGVQLSQSGGLTEVSEAGSLDTYTAVLTSEPTATVTLTMVVDAQIQAIAPLTFTPANWNQAQVVTVRAVDDAVAEGTHTGQIQHQASGGGYDSVSIGAIQASISDNDVIGVILSESSGSTDLVEGGASDTYSLTLRSQPTGTVTIQVQANTQLQVSPSSVQFNASNWSLPQNIVVTAVDDAVAEGAHQGQIQHVATGADYTGVGVPTLLTNITDNDQAGIVLAETGGSTAVSEGGGNDQYSLVLTSAPTGTVTITIQPDSQTSTAPAPSVSFDASNWNQPQFITIRAVDDTVFEGPHTGLIQHSAQGSGYDAISIPTLAVNITDNDPQIVDLSIDQQLLNPVFGPGERVRIEIQVEHLSINTIPGSALVQVSTPPELTNLSWLCAADPGATCAGNGSGPITETVQLSAGSGVTFLLTADVNLTTPPGSLLTINGTVTPSTPDVDSNTANNQDQLQVQVGLDRVFRDDFEN